MKLSLLRSSILIVVLMLTAAFACGNPSTSNTDVMSYKRIHAYFSGDVQGVGFRNTAKHYATKLGLLGWVKNLPDARVELVAEGPESHLATFLTQLELKFKIAKSEITTEMQAEKLAGFKIVK